MNCLDLDPKSKEMLKFRTLSWLWSVDLESTVDWDRSNPDLRPEYANIMVFTKNVTCYVHLLLSGSVNLIFGRKLPKNSTLQEMPLKFEVTLKWIYVRLSNI